jgi:hypothetical protein
MSEVGRIQRNFLCFFTAFIASARVASWLRSLSAAPLVNCDVIAFIALDEILGFFFAGAARAAWK